MSELGWVEGKNITIEYRYGEVKESTRLAELAAELVRLNVDLIVVTRHAGISCEESDQHHPHRDGER